MAIGLLRVLEAAGGLESLAEGDPAGAQSGRFADRCRRHLNGSRMLAAGERYEAYSEERFRVARILSQDTLVVEGGFGEPAGKRVSRAGLTRRRSLHRNRGLSPSHRQHSWRS